MPDSMPRVLIQMEYEEAAREYLRRLPREHFMEATPQATQREITLESFALVRPHRPDLHVYNELLVQYPHPTLRLPRPQQVVPDNMIVLWPEALKVVGSFDVPLQPAGPFWVFEYVSTGSRRKDYHDSMHKYEQELKVPYYLLFYPDNQELTLFHHNGERYVTVLPNEQGRHAIPELEMDVALLDGWARYWFRGELLPLPAELQEQLYSAQRQIAAAAQEMEQERKARVALEQEIERLRARVSELERQGDQK